MTDEQQEFNRRAAAAIYLQGWIVAKLGLPLDSTAKQVEHALALLLQKKP